MNIDDPQIAEMLDRIGRTSDGLGLYLYLQKTLCGVPLDHSGDALQSHHGRRMFALDLMAQMRKGVQESHGGTDPASRPVVFTNREPVRAGGRIGSREYARLVEPGPGPSSDTGTE